MPKQWLIPPQVPDLTNVARHWGVQPIVAQLMLNRGISAQQNGETFLNPQLKQLHRPELLPGATHAATLVVDAVSTKKKIVLYGDYDVDGTTGVAILWHLLHLAGADVSFYVPHRIEEGYGVNDHAIERLIDGGAGLIITVDCGVTAIEAAERARSRGVGFIVTDHHRPHDQLPKADALVHPGLDGSYPNPSLSGSGVAFKLAWAIAQGLDGTDRVSEAHRELLMELLPLAALGTIADMVPLTEENRIIAKCGLERLARTRLAGLRALMASAGLDSGKIDGNDVGFKLAPRINAAGRMGHARLAVELLTRADPPRAREIALYLEDHNRSRQATERRIAKQAYERIDREGLAADSRRAIVLSDAGWHPGVIGIVAARLVERYHRPAILIALSNRQGQGSARSIRHFDLADALASCGQHLLSYGGHAMAAGLRIQGDRVEAFTEAFVSTANNRLTGEDLLPRLRLDAEVSLRDLTLEATESILALGPFGAGNPKPKLATPWIDLYDEPRRVGRNDDHLQAVFREDGVCMKAIGFGLGSLLDDLKRFRRCRVAFSPIVSDFRDHRSAEMQILDLQFPS